MALLTYTTACDLPGKLREFKGLITVSWDPSTHGTPVWTLSFLKWSLREPELQRFKAGLNAAMASIRRLSKHRPNEGLFVECVGGGIEIHRHGDKAEWWPTNPCLPLDETDILEVIREFPKIEAAISCAVETIHRLAG